MPKILIDLTTHDAALLKTLAEQHGQKLKPFIEYLLKMQVGSVPVPSVRPVQIPKQETPKEKPEQEQRKETRKETQAEEPEQIAPRRKTAIENARKPEQEPTQEPQQETRTETTQGTGTETPQWKPNKIDGAYKEKAADRIYTDGMSYRLNLFGSVYYFQTLPEAEAKRDGNK
jgi:hypothetical protein